MASTCHSRLWFLLGTGLLATMLASGCTDSQDDHDELSTSIQDARIDVESAMDAILKLNPPTTGTQLGVSGHIRQTPTPAQWALDNTFRPGIDIDWHPNLVPKPIRIAIIDESFDVKATGLQHAFDQNAGINLLSPGQPLWSAHRDGFHHGNLVASIIANQPVGNRAPRGVLSGDGIILIPIVAAGGSGPAWRTPRATPSLILAGLKHALEANADIINISAGVDLTPGELAELAADPVWDLLEQRGIPVVCAAGNEGRNIDHEPMFPASVDRPNVIAVMSIGPAGHPALRPVPGGTWSSGTNWGPQTVDLAAPGEVIEVQARAAWPELVDGTSAAAAFVTAALAIDREIRVKHLAALEGRCRLHGIVQLGPSPKAAD